MTAQALPPAIRLITYQQPLCLNDAEVIKSVQVKLKTHPYPAGRFSFSGGGRARARSAPAHKSLVGHT